MQAGSLRYSLSVMKTFLTALRLFALLAVLTGILYPLAVTATARVAFPSQANGSLVYSAAPSDLKLNLSTSSNLTGAPAPVGSALLAQATTSPRYFWPRPSAGDYATVASGASNLAPTSQKLRDAISARATALRTAHGLAADSPVPADLLMTSGSGLDPHISPAAATFQAARVATARNLPLSTVTTAITAHTESGGLLGEDRVNVLLLNLALDEASP
jgi:K+-transporting ATPase ATPase C chain